jgi:hypothetical protein
VPEWHSDPRVELAVASMRSQTSWPAGTLALPVETGTTRIPRTWTPPVVLNRMTRQAERPRTPSSRT